MSSDELEIGNEEKHFKKVELHGLDSKKCCVCKNTVYKAEELIVNDNIWHIECFVCGIGATEIGQGEGCGRKLDLGFYQTINKIPYCTSNHKGCYCGDKVAKDLLLKRAPEIQTSRESIMNEDEEIPAPHSVSPVRNQVTSPTKPAETFYEYDLSAFEDKNKNAKNAQEKYAPKYGAQQQCPVCQKTVYKAEELIALGNTWHKDCFTCGGMGGNGCKRKLALGSYQVNNGIQFCNACNDKISRESQSTYARPSMTAKDITDMEALDNTISSPSPAKERPSYMGNMVDDFQSFELSDNFGKPANTKGDKFRHAKDDSTKCPICRKTVYKAEELQALGSVWHQSCFTCGGATDFGCKRKLALGSFQTHNKLPFCATCGDRMAKESQKTLAKTSFPTASQKDNASNLVSQESNTYNMTSSQSNSNDNFLSFELSDDFGKPSTSNAAANKFRSGNIDTRKCPQCNSTVFKAEELVAVGSVWHATCFTCGGVSNQGSGCKRKLALGSFQIHNKIPYCAACSDRVARDTHAKTSTRPRNEEGNSPLTLSADSSSNNYEISTTAALEYENDRQSLSNSRASIADRMTAFQKTTDTSGTNENITTAELTEKRPIKTFQIPTDNSNKCPVCIKTVYKTEQILALKESWHKDCFTCGGKGDLGCKRKLGLDEYRGDGGQPYCGSCYDRLMKERYSKNVASQGVNTGGTGAGIASGAGSGTNSGPPSINKPNTGNSGNGSGGILSSNNSNDNFQSFELSEDFTKPKAPTAADKLRNLTSTGTKKCPICNKTVYKAEEMECMKLSYHKECFTCGGNNGKGCKRRLGMGEAHGKNGDPYCKTCFDKVVKEEIAATRGIGNSNNSIDNFSQPNTGRMSGKGGIASESIAEPEESERDISPPREKPEPIPTNEDNHYNTTATTSITFATEDTNIDNIEKELAELDDIQFEYLDSASPSARSTGVSRPVSGRMPSRPVSTRVTPAAVDHSHNSPSPAEVTVPVMEINSEVTEPVTPTQSTDTFETVYNGDKYEGKKLTYDYDFDDNGAVYWIASKGKTVPYENPHLTGELVVKMSSIFKGSEANVLSREGNNTPCYTGNDPYSYVELDLGPKYTMLLNKYSFRHGGSSKSNLLRNWILQARSNSSANSDPESWITLKEHVEDDTLPPESKATGSWDIDYSPDNLSSEEAMLGFRYFRITQTGPNANNNDCLFCAGLEFYGVLFHKI